MSAWSAASSTYGDSQTAKGAEILLIADSSSTDCLRDVFSLTKKSELPFRTHRSWRRKEVVVDRVHAGWRVISMFGNTGCVLQHYCAGLLGTTVLQPLSIRFRCRRTLRSALTTLPPADIESRVDLSTTGREPRESQRHCCLQEELMIRLRPTTW